jgi:hypothetical protein
MPQDIPSPASTAGYMDDSQSILGWTSAQGRSSALSNHTRAGSTSVAVSVDDTPPAPRETILDRAFQMRYIPGSDRQAGGDDDRMSSIARFEALMKEAEERRKAKDGSRMLQSSSGRKSSMTTGWELEEEDEDSSDGEPDVADFEDGLRMDEDEACEDLTRSIHEMPTPAQRALEYIAGRNTLMPTRRPSSPVPPLPTSRPKLPVRARTTPPVSHRPERPRSLIVTNTTHGLLDPSDTAHSLKRTSSHSTSGSTKRLSFTDFAKRLSSSSSLLLVQTNASTASGSTRNSRQSSEGSYEDEEGGPLHRGLSQSRLSGMAAPGTMGGMRSGHGGVLENDPRAHWRNSSLGVFGGEGGFL